MPYTHALRAGATQALALILTALLVPLGSAAAQHEPARPDSQFIATLGRSAERARGHRNGDPHHGRTVRARLKSSDGRTLVARSGGNLAFAWLAVDSTVAMDWSWFEVTLPVATSDPIVIRDWAGRCLGHSDLQASEPLGFGPCDLHALFTYPQASERGFWLLSKIGYVGPTKVSQMLVPRSTSDLWFSLERLP